MSDLRLAPVENRRRAASLRFHERARRGYWGSRWAAVLPAGWDDDDAAPIIAQVRKCGYLGVDDAVLPSSEDSWEHFVRKHGDVTFDPDVRGYSSLGTPFGTARPSSRAPARLQAEWEAARAEREAGYRAESDRQWGQAERRGAEAARRREEQLAAEAERERLDVVARLGLTELGELTRVYWQTSQLYAVEGARRQLRASRR